VAYGFRQLPYIKNREEILDLGTKSAAFMRFAAFRKHLNLLPDERRMRDDAI